MSHGPCFTELFPIVSVAVLIGLGAGVVLDGIRKLLAKRWWMPPPGNPVLKSMLVIIPLCLSMGLIIAALGEIRLVPAFIAVPIGLASDKFAVALGIVLALTTETPQWDA